MEKVKIGEGILELKTDISKGVAGFEQFQRDSETRFNAMKTRLNAITGSMFLQVGQQAISMAKTVGEAVAKTVVETTKAGAQIYEMSKRTGISAEAISSLGYAARQSETNIQDLLVGMKFISKNAYEAATAGGAAAKTFERLGLNVRDTSGHLKTGDKLFLEAADKIRGLSSETEKTALAMELFGRQGQSLLPILGLGADGIIKLQEESNKLGIGWTTEQAKAADDFADAMARLGEQITAIRQNSIKPYLEDMSHIAIGASNMVRNFQEATSSGVGSTFFDSLKAAAAGAFPVLQSLFQAADALKSKGEWADIMAPIEYDNKGRKIERGGKKTEETTTATAPIENHIKKVEALRDTVAEARKAVLDYYAAWDAEKTGLGPGQAGPSREFAGQGVGEEIGAGSSSFSEMSEKAIAYQNELNAKLREEFEIRWQIKEGRQAEHEQEIANAAIEAEAKRGAALNAMGSIAEGMQMIADNNSSLARAAQILSWVQGVAAAATGWAESFKQGGIYGFAAGAAMFAKIMALLAMMKNTSAGSTPKMKVPGAAEGGIIFKPSVIAVAEKRPEIVMPLDKAGMTGGGNQKMELYVKDIPGLERYLAVKLADRAKAENLRGWEFARG